MLTAARAMQTEVETVAPSTSLVDLERKLLTSDRVGLPVVERGKLVGIVSRSDVVRILAVIRNAEEQRSDFYRSFEGPARTIDPASEPAAVAAAVGERAAGLTVRDAMIRQVVTVDADQPLSEVARLMLDGHLHRLPVVENGELRGIVTTLDIVRLFAQGQVVEAQPDGAGAERLLGPGDASRERLAKRRATLEERLDKLMARTAAIEKDLRASHDKDSQERTTERENDEVLERIGDSERRYLGQIRNALARIEAGTYDACEGCGGPVGEARQAALPEATRCVACA